MERAARWFSRSAVLALAVSASVVHAAPPAPPAAALAAAVTGADAVTPTADHAVTADDAAPPVLPVTPLAPEPNALDLARLGYQRLLEQATQSEREATYEAERAAVAERAALDRAQHAADATARAVAAEQARVAAYEGKLAQVQRALATMQSASSSELGALVEQETALNERAHSTKLSASGADALFHDIVAALERGRDHFELALAAMGSAQPLVPPTPASPSFDAPPLSLASQADRRALELAHDALAARRASLAADEAKHWRQRAGDVSDHLQRLTELRTATIARMSPSVRDELFGLSSAGIRQLMRELRHLRLMAAWYPTSRMQLLEMPETVEGVLLRLGALLGALLKALLVVVTWLLLRRRWLPWATALHDWLTPRAIRDVWARAALVATRAVRAIGAEILVIAMIMGLFSVLVRGALATELDLVYELLLNWAIYRLLLAAAHRFLTSATTDAMRREVSPELSGRILHSLRVVARFGLLVAFVLATASHLLGRGYLYMLVVRFAWVFTVPIAFYIVRAWQGDICDAYLRAYPTGALAAAVARHRDRVFGVLVAFAAFAAVAMTGLVEWLTAVALRFDQTRRALAFVFRRRLEGLARADARPVDELEQLPEALRSVLRDRPAGADDIIGELAGIEAALTALRAWRLREATLVAFVVGAWGTGKTTWLNAFVRQLEGESGGVRIDTIAVTDHIASEADVLATFSGLLDDGGLPPTSAAELGDRLDHGPRRIVLVDDAGRSVFKAMGGLVGFDAMASVIARSTPRIAWVLTLSDHAFARIRQLRGDRDLATLVIALRSFDENHVAALIHDRMTRAGVDVRFGSLVDPRTAATEFPLETRRAETRFVRLIWDQSDGNPRDVLHFWARSLHPVTDGGVEVRLFRAPSVDALESLAAQTRFALHAVLVHDGLSAEEAARTLFEPLPAVQSVLSWLEGRGIVVRRGQRFVVDPHWVRAVTRYLQRKHLLVR